MKQPARRFGPVKNEAAFECGSIIKRQSALGFWRLFLASGNNRSGRELVPSQHSTFQVASRNVILRPESHVLQMPS